MDFDNFNFINDLFSYEVGNQVLHSMEKNFNGKLTAGEFFTRVHADHFIFCVKAANVTELPNRFVAITNIKEDFTDFLPIKYHFVASGGIVSISNNQENITLLLDKANFARKKAKGNHVSTFLIYDNKMHEGLEWKKLITLSMEDALNNNEFEMYLQPKIILKTDELVGAEALVRWKSKEHGMIYPDKFIPILEQNGFIKNIDFFMLEQACLFIKQSIAEGIIPLPISVNFSKGHIQSPDFTENVFQTVKKYAINTNLIEIEFTESTFSENVQAFIDIASSLKYLGFKVSLDDFGREYSALSYLKDIPLDVIKIDKEFLSSSTDSSKGQLLIAKIIELVKSLRLISVMEGVETEQQVEFLKKYSCDLAQGYFYAKPMSKAEYKNFILNSNLKTATYTTQIPNTDNAYQEFLNSIPQEFQMDNWELLVLGKNIDMGLMKGYLDKEATVQYVNDKALEYLGYTRQEFREVFKNSITAFTHPDDIAIVQKNAEQLIASGKPLNFQTRAIRKDGKVIVFQGRSSCVIDNYGRPVGIYAFQDVTEELERTEHLYRTLENQVAELEASLNSEQNIRRALDVNERNYRLLLDQADNILFEWDFNSDHIIFSDKYEKFFGEKPIEKYVLHNEEIRRKIHPEDMYLFDEWIRNIYKKDNVYNTHYRLKAVSGDFMHVRVCSIPIHDSFGLPIKAMGVFTDVHKAI